MSQELKRQLRGDEGSVPHVYPDHLGFMTIAVGRLVDARKPGAGLRQVEIDFMLQNDVDDRVAALTARLPWFKDLDAVRQGVLLNMAFQLGTDGMLAFTTTLGHVQAGRYDAAANAMLQSKWAGQTPERAERMAKQMRTGEWQFAPGA